MAPPQAETNAPSEQAAPRHDVAALTGVAEVDEALARLQQLDALPVEEHVAVFEQAHDTLRQALDHARAESRAG